MSFPIRHLPVLQNWDCQATGSCCKEYLVEVNDEERQRIDAQGWDRDRDLGGLSPFKRFGLLWGGRYVLNHRADGSCVFLSAEGRCRIHEKHGYEAKPLPCRLFPFVLVPQGDRWGVGLRYACPSAARNKGRPLPQHDELPGFAEALATRVGLPGLPAGAMNPPPYLSPTQRIAWPELRLFLDTLLALLSNRQDRIERRLRKCLTFAAQCKQAPRIHELTGKKLAEMLEILRNYADLTTPADPATIPGPTWIGRILFRQLLAIYTRKDHGPNRGPAGQRRLGLIAAAWRFARGWGRVPRMHAWLPETTFEEIEATSSALTPAAEEVLERYFLMKVGSLQFCGGASFGMSFWGGFEVLALLFPVLMWVSRAFAKEGSEEGVLKALSIADDHFGFNKVLGSLRQRFSFAILSRRGETARLIAQFAR